MPSWSFNTVEAFNTASFFLSVIVLHAVYVHYCTIELPRAFPAVIKRFDEFPGMIQLGLRLF